MVSASLTIYFQVLNGILETAAPFLVAWITKEAVQFFRISSSSATAARIEAGVSALSDMALARLHTAASTGVTVSVNDTVGHVLTSASASLLAACAAQGTTPEALAQRVTGSLISKASAAPPVSPQPVLVPAS